MLSKTWITGITIAGIAGSGGAAFAGVNAIQNAAAESAPAASEAAAATRSVTYQIGVAGLVTIVSDGTNLSVSDPHPGTGWTFVGATSGAASHVEVQFTDGQQLVTFGADQIGADIVVSVTNVEAPGATTTTVAPAAIEVTIISESPTPSSEVPPTTPAPTPPVVTTPATTAPSKVTTTKASPKHHEDDEDEHESDHEDEGDDD